MAAITIKNVKKSFGPTSVLSDISLDIADGEFLTLLGPSGCGKSTLLRILAGLEVQTDGSVAIGDRVVDRLRPKERDVAMVFQTYALYPHMTVAQNMALPLRMRRLSSWQRLPLVGRFLPGAREAVTQIDQRVTQTAEAISIGHLLDRKPGQLSGGQRQRVALGRAMVREPAIFLMDEPLSNLDAKLRVQMRGEIKELHKRLGVTFVYVTHDQSEAMTMSDRVAVMLDGRILQLAPPHSIYADPDNRQVAEFIGSPKINMIDASIGSDGRIESMAGTIPFSTGLSNGAQVTIGIRPESFHLAQDSSQEVIAGSVGFIEHIGSDIFVHVNTHGRADPLIARLPADERPKLGSGQRLSLGINLDQILLFTPDGRRLRPSAAVAPLRRDAL